MFTSSTHRDKSECALNSCRIALKGVPGYFLSYKPFSCLQIFSLAALKTKNLQRIKFQPRETRRTDGHIAQYFSANIRQFSLHSLANAKV
jgi:hypothetical protein